MSLTNGVIETPVRIEPNLLLVLILNLSRKTLMKENRSVKATLEMSGTTGSSK